MSDTATGIGVAVTSILAGLALAFLTMMLMGCSTIPAPQVAYENGYAQFGLVFCATEPVPAGNAWEQTKAHISRNSGKYGILTGILGILAADALTGNGLDMFGAVDDGDDSKPSKTEPGTIAANNGTIEIRDADRIAWEQMRITASNGGKVVIDDRKDN